MRRVIIGVTTSVTKPEMTPERAYVNAAYLRAVQAAGGVPVLLPPQLDPASLAALRERLDGLVLTGGGDIAPARFGETPHPAVDDVSEARDALEIDLALHAIDRAVPLLAICRGVQVLNVALGGSLHQDIASDLATDVTHVQAAPRATPTHAVTVQGESRLAATLGALEVQVNSMHHQAVKKLGRGLREVAWAPDGVIEGLEAPEARGFVLGVQWHPEELVGHDPAARALFRALVTASQRR
jgi:putative glutamine amidotransferase